MLKAGEFVSVFIEDFISLLFPTTCLHCHSTLLKNETQICTSCLLSLPTTSYHLSYNDNPLFNDLKINQNVTFAAAYLHYHKFGIAQTLLHQLKYKGNYEIGRLLGSWFGYHLSDNINADVMIPVPIHPKKLKTRGYNQSQAIAEGLQQHLKIPISDSIVSRIRLTNTQTKKNKVNRWRALEGVFSVTEPEKIRAKKIILVDDVITTGSTIASLCEELNKCEPDSIQVLAIATGK